MHKIVKIFEEYLEGQINNVWENIKQLIGDDTTFKGFKKNQRGQAKICTPLLKEEIYNVKTAITSNHIIIENEKENVLYVQVNYMYSVERGNEILELSNKGRKYPIGTEIKGNNELYTLCFGGKYEFVMNKQLSKIQSCIFDCEYASGNTYMIRKIWSDSKRLPKLICNERLFKKTRNSIDVANRFFWAMDTCDSKLYNKLTTKNADITFVSNEDSVNSREQNTSEEFIANAHKLFAQNYHSIYWIETDDSNKLVGYRIRQDNTGNKFRGTKEKYVLFLNEIFNVDLKNEDGELKIEKITSRMVEVPMTMGYSVLSV